MDKEGKTPEALRRLATSTGKASAPADNRRVSENSAAKSPRHRAAAESWNITKSLDTSGSNWSIDASLIPIQLVLIAQSENLTI